MKYLAVAVALASSAAFAIPVQAADEVDVPAARDWSGVYVGLHAGGAWLRADDGDDVVKMSSGAFGAYLGANWQRGNLVFGIEGDVNYAPAEGSIYGFEIGEDWQGSLRGRLGYAMGDVLLYGTGGLAVTQAYVDIPSVLSAKDTLTGWTLGAGAEYAFAQGWTTRVDYRYSDFGGTEFGMSALFGPTDDVEFTEHALRIGIGYKF